MLAGLAGILIILHVVNGIYFAKGLPNCARSYDEAMNSEFSTFTRLIQKDSGYAPLYDTQSYLISCVIGKRWTAIYLIQNTAFLILLVCALVLLGRKIADIETGLIAAILVCLYPLLASAYNSYSMAFPLLALMPLSLYFTIRSNYFQHTRYALLCGAVLLYGVMIKEPFIAYAGGLLILSAALGLRDAVQRRDYHRLRNVSFFILAVAAAIFCYFGWSGIRSLFWERLFMEPPSSVGLPEKSLPYIVQSLWQSQLSLPFFELLIIGMVVFQLRAPRLYRWTFWVCLLIPAAVIYLMPHHFRNRYFLPAMPIFALMSAYALRPLLAKRVLRLLVVPAIVAAGVLQIYGLEKDLWGLSSLRVGSRDYWRQLDLPIMRGNREAFCAQGEPIARLLVELAVKRAPQGGRLYFTMVPNDWGPRARFIHSYSIMNSPVRLDELPKAALITALADTGNLSLKTDTGFLVFLLENGRKMDINSSEYAGMFLESYRRHCATGYEAEDKDVTKDLSAEVREYLRLFEPAGSVPITEGQTAWIFQLKRQT